jgi:hypothetical protein
MDLVAFPGDSLTWDIRPDGSAIVASVNTYCGSAACDQQAMRLAVIDMRAGSARWLTAADETRSVGSPVWSPNGAFVYYGAGQAGANVDLGIYRIRADGTDATRITDPVPPAPAGLPERPFSSSRPQRVTADGLLFWSAFAGEKGTLKVRDLASASDRAFVTDEPCLAIVAWRSAAPGAIIRYGGCQSPTSKLALWDVRTGAQTVIVDRPAIAHDADWEPTGARIAAAVTDTRTSATELVMVTGRDLTPVHGTMGAVGVRWLPAGIAYTTLPNDTATPTPECVFGFSEVRFLPAAAGPSKSLYSACGIGVFLTVEL